MAVALDALVAAGCATASEAFAALDAGELRGDTPEARYADFVRLTRTEAFARDLAERQRCLDAAGRSQDSYEREAAAARQPAR